MTACLMSTSPVYLYNALSRRRNDQMSALLTLFPLLPFMASPDCAMLSCLIFVTTKLDGKLLSFESDYIQIKNELQLSRHMNLVVPGSPQNMKIS